MRNKAKSSFNTPDPLGVNNFFGNHGHLLSSF
jgi:hypothetical protein